MYDLIFVLALYSRFPCYPLCIRMHGLDFKSRVDGAFIPPALAAARRVLHRSYTVLLEEKERHTKCFLCQAYGLNLTPSVFYDVMLI